MSTAGRIGIVSLGIGVFGFALLAQDHGRPDVTPAAKHDKSLPLGQLRVPPRSDVPREHPLRTFHSGPASSHVDPVVQTSAGPLIATTSGLNFAGVGNGDYSFFPNAAPPDTNGAVGATQYVQDRKSTRLNSSHSQISYAVFC